MFKVVSTSRPPRSLTAQTSIATKPMGLSRAIHTSARVWSLILRLLMVLLVLMVTVTAPAALVTRVLLVVLALAHSLVSPSLPLHLSSECRMCSSCVLGVSCISFTLISSSH